MIRLGKSLFYIARSRPYKSNQYTLDLWSYLIVLQVEKEEYMNVDKVLIHKKGRCIFYCSGLFYFLLLINLQLYIQLFKQVAVLVIGVF